MDNMREKGYGKEFEAGRSKGERELEKRKIYQRNTRATRHC